jgi:hypothetical protein
MHAHIHDLLSLRDGEPVEAGLLRHVEQCPQCTAQVNRLNGARRNLRALPAMDPPAAAFGAVRERLRERPVTRVHWSLVAGVVGAAVLIGVVSFGLIESHQRLAVAGVDKPVPLAPVSIVVAPPSVAELVAQSRQLDDLLQELPQRPSVERIATAATLDTIEERIQWLDVQLSYASTAELNEKQAQRLWSERVDLMDSLVKVRYAEAGSLRF